MDSEVEVDGQPHSTDDSQKLNADVSHEENGIAEDTGDHSHVNGVGKGENGATKNEPDHQKDDDASDAQAQVITSLRSQVTDLFTQVAQLNSKLVASYDRVSDLEDQIHVSSASLRNATLQVSELELERTQHLAALNTGLLVEREHVTAELNRLMERATLEAAQRGQAESARQDIEKDLDDLSASLFHQANTMVAEARLAAAQSERKAGDAEEALKTAEEAVRGMQSAMQELMADRENARIEAERARIRMGKGKWVDRGPGEDGIVLERQLRLMNTHQPFADFLTFVGHLRSLRASGSGHPPAMSALLSLPFPARLLTEDSEPTLRLDLAPSLNWLTRRSVLAAIHTGMLSVGPIPLFSLLQELYPHAALPPPPSHPSHPYAESHPLPANVTLSCALCGTSILPPSTPPNLALAGSNGKDRERERSSQNPLTSLTMTRNLSGNSAAWLRGLTNSNSGSNNNNIVAEETAASPTTSEAVPVSVPEQIFIFRLNTQNSSLAALASTPSAMPNIPNPFSVSSAPPSHPSHAHPTSPGRASSSSQSIKQLTTGSPARIAGGGGGQQQPQQQTPYPLCASNYCLMRLRSTCSLWAFVRSGIVEHVWEETMSLPPHAHAHSQHGAHGHGHGHTEVATVPGSPPSRPRTPGRDRDSQRGISFGFAGGSPGKGMGSSPPVPVPPPAHPSTNAGGANANGAAQNGASGEKAPPVPPRRRGIWGMASALGEAFQERGRGKAGSRWGSRDVSAEQSAAASAKGSGESGSAPGATSAGGAGVEVEPVNSGVSKEGRALPPPPPSHPAAPHAFATAPPPAPPPLPRRNTDRKPVPNVPDVAEAAEEKKLGEDEEKEGDGEHEEHEHVKEETLFDSGHEHGHGHEEKHEHDEVMANNDEEKEKTAVTPAASEDKDDAFLTPTDEVPAHSLADAALVTPPATPGADKHKSSELSPAVRKSLDLSAATNPGAVPLPPSRSDSPAPVSPASAGASASGAPPPPIPRRAPARRAVPAPPGTPAAASTPVSPQADASALAVEEKKEEEAEKKKDAESGEPGESKPAEASQSQEDMADMETVAEPVDVDTPVAASESEPAPAPVPGAELGRENENEAEANADGAAEAQPEGEGEAVDESKPEVHAKADMEKGAPPDPGFTTDTTWEERTWREVVRLREEMFWARVGGVR